MLWVGLICTHAAKYGDVKEFSIDNLKQAVRFHWLRGSQILKDDLISVNKDYNKFVLKLINRAKNSSMELENHANSVKGAKIEPQNHSPNDEYSENIMNHLIEFNIGSIVLVKGPRITRYQIPLQYASDATKIERKMDSFSVVSGVDKSKIKISTGKMLVNIDIPRTDESTWQVYQYQDFRKWIDDNRNNSSAQSKLDLHLGVDILGAPKKFNLIDAHHILVGGSTGSGKSVCLHAIICSLLVQNNLDDLQILICDPSKAGAEFKIYNSAKHLKDKNVIKDYEDMREKLVNVVTIMDERNRLFESRNIRNISEARNAGMSNLPYIVIVIDEFADIFLDKDNKEVFEPILIKLLSRGRSAGIHLILATQRPDAKTFDGQIRSNVPSRIALKVQKSTESRIILDETGAESLLGKGDMLVKWVGMDSVQRIQGVNLSSKDINKLLEVY